MAIESALVGQLGGVKPQTHSVTIGDGFVLVAGPISVSVPTLLVVGTEPGLYGVIADAADPDYATVLANGSMVVSAGTWWLFVGGVAGTYSVTTLVMPL